MDIIPYLLSLIQSLYQQNCWLIHFICRHVPLKQWAFDDSHYPKYQKFKVDELPLVTDFRQGWTYKELIPYYQKHYGKKIRPVSRRSECDIPDDCTCPRCDAPKPFLYKNNGSKGQLLCKVCAARSSPAESRFSSVKLRCPHCGNALDPKKERKHFILHKCVNAATRSIIGYQVSDNRGVGPCILAMRMAFRGLTKLPENFKFIADGYSAYPLAAMEFANLTLPGIVCTI